MDQMTESRRLAVKILHHLTWWRIRFRRNFNGTIVVAVYDLRALDEQDQAHRNNGLWTPSTIRVGDTATMWGSRCRAAELLPGTALLEGQF